MDSRPRSPVRLATRGSALALAQSRRIRDALAACFPEREFELVIIKTTGDRLPTASLANAESGLPRGLFTKELETALLEREADLAVHSLKDLPTELPAGLVLASIPPREDVREVLLYRSESLRKAVPEGAADWSPGRREPWFGQPGRHLKHLPQRSVLATSSTRRAAAVRCARPDLEVVPIRGNVGTRLRKLREGWDLDATLLAAAGLVRLNWDISPQGVLRVDPRLPAAVRATVEPPAGGLQATLIEPEQFLPAVGQGALGLETRSDDEETRNLCLALNHFNTQAAVTAERSLLAAMGGGCQAPVAAWGRVLGHQVVLSAEWYRDGKRVAGEARRSVREAELLGRELAAQLLKA